MEVAAAGADEERLASRLRKAAYSMMTKLSFIELCSCKTICQGMMNFPPLSFHSSKMLWGLLRANSNTMRPLVTKVFTMLNSKSIKRVEYIRIIRGQAKVEYALGVSIHPPTR